MATSAAAGGYRRSYEEFEPFCKWEKGEQHEILQIHLHGFTKDQLRVQVNNEGLLMVTGERPLEGNKWSRFRKETNISKDFKTNEIRAKFSSGVLYVTIPRKAPQEQPKSGPLPQEKNTNKATTSSEASEQKTKTASTLISRLKVSSKVAAGASLVVLVSMFVAYLVLKYWQRYPYSE